MQNVDFSQFGPFAIVFILMSIALVILYREWRAEKKRADDALKGQLEDALKRDELLGAIYDLISDKPNGRRR